MTDDPDVQERLARIISDEVWQKPAARDLALWLVALTASPTRRRRPWWAARVALAALTGRRHYG